MEGLRKAFGSKVILDAHARNAPADELKAIEDKAILEVLQRQKDLGFKIFSDGELRRSTFMSDFNDSVEGVESGDAVARQWSGQTAGNLGVAIVLGAIGVAWLIAASLLAGRVLQPLGNIAMTLSRAQQAFSAMRGISELMALPREGQDVAKSATVADARLEFRNLSFQYDGQGRRALDDVSLTIQPGERVGIIGKIGSGKTTLGKIAAGFFEPSQGAVLVGGTDTRAYETADLRAALAYVPQEPELFTGTLRDNIVLGNPHAAPDEIEEAVRTSGVDAFAAMHPLGLDMPIGERGRGLSGGQRQAVALARMLLRNPKILFLDEPSSAMEAGSEAALVRNLAAWRRPDRDPTRPVYVISVAASIVSVHPRTLRIYEEEGLLCPQRRNNLRLYSEADLQRVRIIRFLTRRQGVNLAGVKVILQLEALGKIRVYDLFDSDDVERFIEEGQA